MRIVWVFEGKGAGGADVEDAEAAASLLTAAVRRAYEELPADALAAVLGPVMRLRQPMVTDGRAAVEQGRDWSTRVGGVFVTLSPS